MDTTAATTRHLKTLWRGEQAWHWLALFIGHVQPRGYRTWWRNRWTWQWHLTPLHVSRDGRKWTAGLCWGRRTIYLYRHQ
jgi:predicted DCC family thiol-disulfide oxidoreductase YuxK